MINFLLIILLAIFDGTHGSDPTLEAEPGQFNYFVMVWYGNKFQCGGTIIDQRHIITRGTCVTSIPSSNLSVIAGTVDTRNLKTEPLQVESVHIHYGFRAVYNLEISEEIHWVHDIAVLKLVNQMVWNPLTVPAVLITEEYNWNEDCRLVVPGWRSSYKRHDGQRFYIRWIEAYAYSDHTCIRRDDFLLKNQKCAHWRAISNPTTIHRYSGSPVVDGNTVIGIADDRKRGNCNIFLNLLPYKDFIANVIDDRKYDASPGDANYVVTIWNQGSFKCGGIILNALHILTTGYCVQYANLTDLQVIAGYTQISGNNPSIPRLSINNIEMHPGYEEIIHVDGPKSMQIKNNNAVLTLAVPLEWGLTIGPVLFTNNYFVHTHQVCRAFRWHYAYIVDDEALLQLVWSQEVILGPEACRNAGIDLEANEICAYSQYAQHPNGLDSTGNPVVCEGFTIGMIIPDFSTVPRFSCLTSFHSLSPFMNSLNNACYGHPRL